MVQTVYLDDNESEHAVTMLRGLRQEQDHCDFIIIVGGIEYPVHKSILSVGSPYFKSMLKHDTKESRDGKVEMKNVDPKCVKSCIDFLYSGKFVIPDRKVGPLLHVAIMWQLDKVKETICDFLDKSLNAENFYVIKRIAEMYDLKTISKKCKIYYVENLMAISSQPGFENEEKSHLMNILKSRNLKLSEEEKLTVSLRWVGENSDKKETLFELIKLINLKDVPTEYLRDILKKHCFISNDFHLYKLINDSCWQKADEKTGKISNNEKDLIVLFDGDADCIRSFDPATDEVTKLHNQEFKQLNNNFCTVCMDSYIYVLCADKSVYRLNFRDKDSKWERMRGMIGEHGGNPPVASLSGSLFVIGGSFFGPTNIVEKLDVAANRWLRLEDKPKAISDATLVSLNDSIFCIGGHDENVLGSFCRFTPHPTEWVDLEPMKNVRYGCGAVAVEQKIFVMGGVGGWSYEGLKEAECYDIVSGHWTSLPSMLNPHVRCVAHHTSGWIFLVGGGEKSDTVEKYDVKSNIWYKVDFKDVDQFKICDSVKVN